MIFTMLIRMSIMMKSGICCSFAIACNKLGMTAYKIWSSLNKFCVDCIKEAGKIKVEKDSKKYIVNVNQGLFDYEVSGFRSPIFVDINGNIFTSLE